jgi:hypothetical protein
MTYCLLLQLGQSNCLEIEPVFGFLILYPMGGDNKVSKYDSRLDYFT